MKKLFFRSVVLGIAVILLIIIVCEILVTAGTNKNIFIDTSTIPVENAALVLGTAKYVAGGRINTYYSARIRAASELYASDKVQTVIVSGDNHTSSYNEPETFKADLIAAGIPESKIILDYAGFRTLDSVVRAKAVFGQNSITIVSQRFHIVRALYLAKHYDVDAVGYVADDAVGGGTVRVWARERLARVKVVMDVIAN